MLILAMTEETLKNVLCTLDSISILKDIIATYTLMNLED